MQDLLQKFEGRLQEIEAYLRLLDVIEKQVQDGVPRIGETISISVDQQKILYSSVFLQLYNLIEATITNCVDGIANAVTKNGSKPNDLSEDIRREWIRFMARTHTDLNFENRLKETLSLCEHLIQSRPVSDFKIEKGQGGNWDDLAIQDICKRLGLPLTIESDIASSIKRPFKNDQGSLIYIKTLRNDLAHGSLSFVECGANVTVSDLQDLKDRTVSYLRAVVKLFQNFIDTYEYLLPQQRPKK
jgi:hypothetical protein